MTSRFELAEFMGGPLDGSVYEKHSEFFPRRLEITFDGCVHVYRADAEPTVDRGRIQSWRVVYRHAGRREMEVIR